jgi:hypothetical protein
VVATSAAFAERGEVAQRCWRRCRFHRLRRALSITGCQPAEPATSAYASYPTVVRSWYSTASRTQPDAILCGAPVSTCILLHCVCVCVCVCVCICNISSLAPQLELLDYCDSTHCLHFARARSRLFKQKLASTYDDIPLLEMVGTVIAATIIHALGMPIIKWGKLPLLSCGIPIGNGLWFWCSLTG